MAFLKVVYDDFYRFIMSVGFFSIALTFLLGFFSKNSFVWVLFGIVLIISSLLINWAGKKWHRNQKIIDDKLRAENELIKKQSSKIILPNWKEKTDVSKKQKKSALVEYKIDSVLPETVHFDFIKDWKVWFLIVNRERKKYRAYIKIKFVTENFEKEITRGYYGGERVWNLNAFSAIRAPGLEIPQEIRRIAKQKKKIEIRVNCTIMDENDKLVEKKLPQGYVYDYNSKNWYLEP